MSGIDFFAAPQKLALMLGGAGVIFFLTWIDLRGSVNQRAALKAFAERNHFDREPGDAEFAFKTVHQGWPMYLGMRPHSMDTRSKRVRPTLMVKTDLEWPRGFKAIPRVWRRPLPPEGLKQRFRVGNAALDERFVWLCERAEQPRAYALLSRPDVQRALMALGSGVDACVRIEENQVHLILEHGLDDFVLARHMDALADVAKALHQALAPARAVPT